ncbi:hypothetical protein RHS01_11373 [Rhizoctonia solani]|uniref:RNA-directed DNA polymerase n=1 Tax=Rhizoctonia solani TaxID=456999 RepID=A0A8H7I537_9AGAM|nr:hypothetical protein RHS01_11373 [Rhizoctonia solani]
MSIEPLFCAALQTNKSPLLTIDIEGITDTQTALIDSGSSANFIDPQFARSHNIPLIELDSPRSVIGINGKQAFSAIFYALPLGNRNLILGTPWLKLANPDIDWTTMKVSLRLATEARTGSINPEPQNLPVEFQEFQKVFSEEFFTTLPEHCPYDITIDLEEDKQPPYGPIYSMTPAEREALKEYIDSELAAGKIVPTTSPAGAPVMFLDLRNGYHNIRIKEGDEWKAAFCTALGHFAPTVMQFGLSNAPAVFMRFMNDIFHDLLDISVVVYLDDILIFSNSREEHVEHVKEVLSHLLKHNLFCNPAKCYFFVTEVTYIGLVITPEGISMEKDKVQAIMDWPEPQNVKQVQSFLGFANFYRRFVPNFSRLARPLNNLTQKEQPWIWLEEQKAAFDAIKAEICKEPVLAHPDESKPYTLETDASGAAMGAVLSQRMEDGCLHPVAFMSASFSPAELNYDTHDKELLAIIQAFEHWRIFLEGTEQPITVFTDHKNLEYWKSARTFNRRHARWHLMLASYNFVIAYRPGKQSQKPDALSRRSDHMDLEPAPQIMIPESHFEAFSAHIDSSLLDQIKEDTQEDPSLDTILLAVSDPKSMPHNVAQKFKDYTIQKGLLLYQGRVVVPDEPEIKQQLLSHFHDSPASGHQGRARTLELISCHYYWPAMKFQVNRYVETCEICQRSKGHLHNYALNPLSVPAGPWEDISYDFIVKFPKCKGYDSILVVVDRFSKMMHLVPCKETATAEDVAQMFLEHVWKLHGTPKRTKRSNRQIALKIVYGRSPVISPLLEPTGSPIADDRAKQLAETIQAVQASIKWAQERYKQADTGKPPPEFQPGDKVWLLASNITLQRPNKKLDHKQYGPFPVIERVGSHAYCLALPETMKIHDVFHVSLLSAFKQDTEFDRTFTPPPPVITAEGEEEYKVDRFVDWAAEDGIWKCRVRWKGYAPHEDTWEPAKDLQHCKDELRNF